MSLSQPPLHTIPVGLTARTRQRLVVLHGIYGRGRNWQTVAREVTTARPEWGAWLVDLRLHGDSPAFAPPHTVEAAAEDVRRLIDGAPGTRALAGGSGQDEPASVPEAPVRALLGHSFGGKVTLAVAATPPDTLRQVWVIDAAPGTQEPAGSAWDMITHVRSLPPAFAARADAIAGLERLGWPVGVASWMATNLHYDSATREFRWALDLDAMTSLLESYFTTDLWHVIESPPDHLELHIVKASGSSTVSEDTCARIERAAAAHGRVHLHRVEGSHWLNVDNPRALLDLLTRHLPS